MCVLCMSCNHDLFTVVAWVTSSSSQTCKTRAATQNVFLVNKTLDLIKATVICYFSAQLSDPGQETNSSLSVAQQPDSFQALDWHLS